MLGCLLHALWSFFYVQVGFTSYFTVCIAPSLRYLCQCQRVWCALVSAPGPSQLRLPWHLVSWSFRITPLFLLLMSGLKSKVLHKHACYVAWLSSSVVLMLWVSFLFCCCTLMFPRLTLYVFVLWWWLDYTVFYDVLASPAELRGWFAWCILGSLLLLMLALGAS